MSKSSTKQFTSLIDLFESINVVEKGIEQVYNYILKAKKVDDLKEIENALGLQTKRIYKVCAVLKDLGLIQIYNRPMKLQLLDPVTSWETLIQDKINDIRKEAEEKIEICHSALERMEQAYNLKDAEFKQNPVEFISLLGDIDIETLYTPIISTKESCFAYNILYKYNYKAVLTKGFKDKEELKLLKSTIKKMSKTTIKFLIGKEIIDEVKKYFKMLEDFIPDLKKLGFQMVNIDVRVTKEDFSNFVVKDRNLLIQPSFDPNENLIGYFNSSTQEIVDIFYNKFNDLYKNSKSINDEIEFIKKLKV